VIPDGADFAPMRTTARRRDLSAPGYPLDLLRGAPVSGSVTQAGAPLAGARVELTSASAPSSLGRTDAAGAWQVRASAGQSYGVVVAAAATTALPVAEVADTLVAIDAAGNAPAVSFDYDPITTHRLGGQVVLASGEAAGRSRVHVTARPLARVGLLTIGGGAPVPVGGHFRRDLSTDNAGQLAPIDLPAAVYDVLIEPPAGAGQARTRLVLDLLAADRPAERLVLAAPVLLSGRVVTSDTPAYPLAGTPVTVVERGATAVFAVLTDGDGRFQVAVDPAASYDVSATPRVPTPLPTELWARVRVQADVGAGDLELPDLLAPLGKLASGRVTDGSGSPLAGTLVEAFVGACSPGQPAAAEATTDSTGSFRVIVPAAPTTSAPAARRPRLR